MNHYHLYQNYKQLEKYKCSLDTEGHILWFHLYIDNLCYLILRQKVQDMNMYHYQKSLSCKWLVIHNYS